MTLQWATHWIIYWITQYSSIIIAVVILILLLIIIYILSKLPRYYWCDQCGEQVKTTEAKRHLTYQDGYEIEHWYCEECAKKMEAEKAKEMEEIKEVENEGMNGKIENSIPENRESEKKVS